MSVRATLLRLLSLPFALALLMAPIASAETGVRAVVCTGDSQPTLTISPEINDSVLRVNTVNISGLVERVSAVEVYANTEYDHTIAIPANETTFATSVRLPIGTHTLRIEAIGICSGNNATREAVVTIIPWNYGFARPGAADSDQTPAQSDSDKDAAESESLQEIAASMALEEKADGLIGFLQTIFPGASPKELIFTTAFLAAAALPLLPSSVLAQAAAGQVILGRRTLFLAVIPFLGLIFMAVSS